MSRRIDMTGKKMGMWTVLGISKTSARGSTYWECRCECGNVKSVIGDTLRNGDSTSCGCQKGRKATHGYTTNGNYPGEYASWNRMILRCYNEKDISYHRYGGRGITVCDRWRHSFQNFIDDMGDKPTKSHTLDRKDPDGQYGPSNCRWATKQEQACNRRSSVYIEHNAKRMVKADWARLLGVPQGKFNDRLTRYTFPEMLKRFHPDIEI